MDTCFFIVYNHLTSNLNYMALTGKLQKENEGTESEQEVFSITFSNGTFSQLKELSAFFKKDGLIFSDDPTDVVKLGISFLLTIKENREKESGSQG